MKIRMQCMSVWLDESKSPPMLRVFLEREDESCTLLLDPRHASLFAPPAFYDVTVESAKET